LGGGGRLLNVRSRPQTRNLGSEGCGLRLRQRERIRRSLLLQPLQRESIRRSLLLHPLQLLLGLGLGAPRSGSGCLGRQHGGRAHIQFAVVASLRILPLELVGSFRLIGLPPSGLPLARTEVTGDLACDREVKRYIQSMQDLPLT